MGSVTGSFAATGQSAALPIRTAGQGVGESLFNIYLDGTAVATVQLERQPPGSSTWYPIDAAGTQLYVWSYSGSAISETGSESEAGVSYRLNCTAFTSGPLNYRISQ